MRTKRFYRVRLQKYFDEFYGDYANTAGFYNDPSPNQWSFEISELSIKVLLTCDDEGVITEQRNKI